jgi:preprotein translocase subunit SecG
MFTALLIFQVLLGLSIIGLVLLQQGKGADMGAAFGAGASGTVFGARGSGSFFSRATAVLAAAFFANSVLLSSPLVLGDRHPSESSIAVKVPVAPAPEAPATEGTAPDKDAVDLPPADLLPEVDTTGAAGTAPADVPETTAAPAPAKDEQLPAAAGKPAAKDTAAKKKDTAAKKKDAAAGKQAE